MKKITFVLCFLMCLFNVSIYSGTLFPTHKRLGDETDQVSRFLCFVKHANLVMESDNSISTFKNPCRHNGHLVTYKVGKYNKEFGNFDRGTDWKRVCISNLIGDMEDLH